MDNQKSIFMSAKEAAEYLGVTKSHMARMREWKIGPKWYNIGLKLIKYKQSDVDEWIEEQALRPSSDHDDIDRN